MSAIKNKMSQSEILSEIMNCFKDKKYRKYIILTHEIAVLTCGGRDDYTDYMINGHLMAKASGITKPMCLN